jgi:small GTP-binding protein
MTKHIKCVTIGDGAVGKTSLLISFITNSFPSDYIPTVFDNYTIHLSVDNNIYTLDLWDTAGQEEYDRLRPLSYPHTDVFLLCYSIIYPQSFENIKYKWYYEIRHYEPTTPIVLAGLKCDMREQYINNSVSFENGLYLQKEIRAKYFHECSALTQKNMKNLFSDIVRATYIKPNKKNKKCLIL